MSAEKGETGFRAKKNQSKGMTVLVEDFGPSCWRFAPSSIGQHCRNLPVGPDPQRRQQTCRELTKRRTGIHQALHG